ncbi:MAG TPA: type III pantothenate kinase [Burkholderiales bacterium]|nr:type III pantothenate kinase [Burkholderiales bacterium]
MKLFVDSGNSRVKWGMHDGEKWVALGKSDRDGFKGLALLWKKFSPYSALGSNVAGSKVQESLEECIPSICFNWIKSEKSRCGVENAYDIPEKLGTDRWAALIGARKLLPEGGLVIGAGTALTADILSAEGRFEGGIIAPGLKTMNASLKGSTRLDFGQGHYAFPPKNTNDAVMTGAILCLSGAIEKLSRSLGNPQCLIHGGDAKRLLPHLDEKVKIEENLVLEGLLLLSGDRK